MVAIVLIHMVQVFLFGAYKFPRELTWIVGVFLLLMTLGMAFSGHVCVLIRRVLGLGIGASIAVVCPLQANNREIGCSGGPVIAGATRRDFRAACPS